MGSPQGRGQGDRSLPAKQVSGSGEMATRIREFDWSRTPLGPIADWSEALLTSVNMILSAPLPMQLFWGSELVVIYNDGLIPIMTDKHPDALGRPAREAWAEAWPTVGPQMEGVLGDGAPISFSDLFVPIRRHGVLEDAYWDYSYSPIHGPYGEVEGVLDVVKDVTTAVLTERSKRESDERLDLAMEGAELGMWFYDSESGVVVADRRMHKIFGSPDTAGPVDYWLDLLDPEDSERVGEHFAGALSGKHLYDLEYRILRADGVRWVRSKGRVVGPPDGPKRMFAIIEDITARKATETALLASEGSLRLSQEAAVRSEQQLKVITDALPAYVSYLDPSLRYVRVNRTYEDWLQKPAEEIVGRSLEEVLGPEAAKTTGEHLRKALQGQPQYFEYKIRTGERERVLSVAHIPDLDELGRPRGVIVQGQDITERKRAEDALIQSEKLAAVGRLAASIAHEINNPLESVTNLLYLASLSETLAEAQGYVEMAERELRRVSVISNQTLRFYKQTTAPRAVTGEDLIESVLSIHQGKLLNSRIKVELRMRAKEPIRCFDGEIRQVLNNLVGNAVDAMHPGGGRLLLRSRATCDWKTAEKGIMLTIADTGAGMSEQVLEKVFEAFYTTKGIGGTGLGLWVSKEIVDRHHGSLRVRSTQRAGRSGTVFALFLPFIAVNREL